MKTKLEFNTILIKYSQQIENVLRLDDEVSDLLLSSPIESFEYILNRDITIFLKPYALINFNHVKQILKKSEYFFDLFYDTLEYVILDPKIYIPMIRYFIFSGKDRKLFTVFLEFHKQKKMFPLLLLSAYITTFDSEEFKNYKNFIEGNYNKQLFQILDIDHLYYFSFKKNFDVVLKKIDRFHYLKKYLEEFSKVKSHFHKILIHNWIFTNLLTKGNFYVAYQFYLWLKKKEEFLFKNDLLISWELKFAFIFVKNQKFSMLKQLKNQEYFFYNQKEFLHIYKEWFPQLLQKQWEDIFSILKILTIEYDVIQMYLLIHLFYEEIMLIGLKFFENGIELDPSILWDSIKKIHSQIDHQSFLLMDTIESKEFLVNFVFYLIYKYRKKLIQFFYMDPFYRGVIGLFYENFKPDISKNAYETIRHPLTMFRFYEFYMRSKNSDKNLKLKIKKKVENLKFFFMMANKNDDG